MQELITIKLDEKVFAEEFSGTISREALLGALAANLNAVEELLVSYHFRSRGRVFGVEIDPSSLSILSPASGRFRVNYNVGLFNACADLDFTEKEKMDITYELQASRPQLLLLGEFIPEREPDEF